MPEKTRNHIIKWDRKPVMQFVGFKISGTVDRKAADRSGISSYMGEFFAEFSSFGLTLTGKRSFKGT